MRKERLVYSLIISFVIFVSCATVGKDFPGRDMVKNIQTGKTTKLEILDMFGAPYRRGIEDGDETWTYVYWKVNLIGSKYSKDLLGGDIEVVRRDERKIVRRQRTLGSTPLSYSYQSLAYRKTRRNMQPFLIEFDLDIQEEIPSLSHEGEEFLYLLEGELEFRTEKEGIILHEGDSLYFDSQISHAFYGRGKKKP